MKKIKLSSFALRAIPLTLLSIIIFIASLFSWRIFFSLDGFQYEAVTLLILSILFVWMKVKYEPPLHLIVRLILLVSIILSTIETNRLDIFHILKRLHYSSDLYIMLGSSLAQIIVMVLLEISSWTTQERVFASDLEK